MSARSCLPILVLALVLAGCERNAPAPGPVALRDAAHLREFLTSTEHWTLSGRDVPDQHWSFRTDGTCRAWIVPGEASPALGAVIGMPDLPDAATMITAAWTATGDTLSLTGIRTEHGDTVPDVQIPLRWLDGKVRMGIAGHQYTRARRRPAGGEDAGPTGG